jgi:hypothetical protein
MLATVQGACENIRHEAMDYLVQWFQNGVSVEGKSVFDYSYDNHLGISPKIICA